MAEISLYSFRVHEGCSSITKGSDLASLTFFDRLFAVDLNSYLVI